MITIVIRVTEDVSPPGERLGTVDDDPAVGRGDHLRVADLLAELEGLPEDAVTIRHGTTHPDWERGDPCPECGNESLTVFEVARTSYRSASGEFTRVDDAELTGPQVSVGCPICLTHLAHLPYEAFHV